MNWEQFKTILWLRWRLNANQWKKGGGVNALLATLALVGGVAIGIGALVGGGLLGFFMLRTMPAHGVMLVWDFLVVAFLFFWVIGTITELQRSETVDLTRMLHLPVSLRGAFYFNYLASHLTLSLVFAMPFAVGTAMGFAVGRGMVFILMLPLVLALLFALTSWTYCVRGWLASLMTNPRRKRSILMGLGVGVMLLVQIPNLYFNIIIPREGGGRRDRVASQSTQKAAMLWSEEGLMAHWLLPPAWVGRSAYSLVQHQWMPALLCTAGLAGLGWIGLRVSYRATLRFHRGEEKLRPEALVATLSAVPSMAGAVSAPFPWKRMLVARSIPGFPEQASAVATAGIRSLLRAAELRAMLASQFVLVLVFGAMFIGGRRSGIPEEMRVFASLPLLAMTSFGLIQLFYNQFGIDRDGFRAFVLAPIPRHWLLLGRNAMLLPLPLILTLVILAVVWGMGLFTGWQVAATLIQWATFSFLLCTVGNLLSIVMPYRIASGSMRPTKTPFLTGLLLFAAHLSFPLLLIPVLVGVMAAYWGAKAWGIPEGPLLVVMSLMMGVVTLVIYVLALEPTGRLLQRRERQILQVVTQEVE